MTKINTQKAGLSLIAFLFMANITFAQIEEYSFKRKLDKVEKEGFYSIPLLPEITARCKSNTSDIRLFSIKKNDTTEVPYLFEWKGTTTEETAVPFELINDTYNEKCCSYVTLKFEKKKTINQIKLNVAESNFDKRLKIEGSNDNKQWFTIREHMRIVGFRNSNENYVYSTLNFQNTEYNYFRIKFDDDGSPRITVTEAFAFENRTTPGQYNELKISGIKQEEIKKEKTSVIIVNLPFTYLVNHIQLKSNSKNNFYRNINVYGSHGTIKTEKGSLENWYTINTSIFSSEEECTINCGNSKTKLLKIEIINYDNEPILVNTIKAFSEDCQLIANIPASETVYLAYGKENDNSPNYDLVHFSDRIPDSLMAISYGEEQVKIVSTDKKTSLIESKKWLWIAMGIVLVIIGYFSLSMLRNENRSE